MVDTERQEEDPGTLREEFPKETGGAQCLVR